MYQYRDLVRQYKEGMKRKEMPVEKGKALKAKNVEGKMLKKEGKRLRAESAMLWSGSMERRTEELRLRSDGRKLHLKGDELQKGGNELREEGERLKERGEKLRKESDAFQREHERLRQMVDGYGRDDVEEYATAGDHLSKPEEGSDLTWEWKDIADIAQGSKLLEPLKSLRFLVNGDSET